MLRTKHGSNKLARAENKQTSLENTLFVLVATSLKQVCFKFLAGGEKTRSSSARFKDQAKFQAAQASVLFVETNMRRLHPTHPAQAHKVLVNRGSNFLGLQCLVLAEILKHAPAGFFVDFFQVDLNPGWLISPQVCLGF